MDNYRSEQIEIEQDDLERIKEQLVNKERIWFKTKRQADDIEFLKKYIQLKQKLISALK